MSFQFWNPGFVSFGILVLESRHDSFGILPSSFGILLSSFGICCQFWNPGFGINPFQFWNHAFQFWNPARQFWNPGFGINLVQFWNQPSPVLESKAGFGIELLSRQIKENWMPSKRLGSEPRLVIPTPICPGCQAPMFSRRLEPNDCRQEFFTNNCCSTWRWRGGLQQTLAARSCSRRTCNPDSGDRGAGAGLGRRGQQKPAESASEPQVATTP